MSFGQLQTQDRAHRPISDINVTPLVDVMLVLVVIFILTAPLLASSIRLNLPQTEAAQAQADAQAMTLVIDAAGQLYVGEQPVSEPQLAVLLQQAAQQRPDTEVQLRADARVPYGRVLKVIGLAQQAGLGRIGFVAEPLAKPE